MTQVECKCVHLGHGIRLYSVTAANKHTSLVDGVLVAVLSVLILLQLANVVFPHHNIILLFWLIPTMLRIPFKLSEVREESLMAMEGIGVQLKTRYATGREKQVFIDKPQILQIVINEGIRIHRCFFYMFLMLKRPGGRTTNVVAFQHLLPPLHELRQIYQGTRAILFGEQDPQGGIHMGMEKWPEESGGGADPSFLPHNASFSQLVQLQRQKQTSLGHPEKLIEEGNRSPIFTPSASFSKLTDIRQKTTTHAL